MKKYLIKLVCCCLLLVFYSVTRAQNTTPGVIVQGIITDADKKPVVGVTVAEVDEDGRTIRATKTDIEGNFSLKVSNIKHKLSISHISHKTVEFAIDTRTVFNVALDASTKDLTDVVVLSQKRVDNGMVSIAEK